jgi:hypothetical protein
MDDESNGDYVLVRTAADRVGIVVFASILWSIAAWMFWIVQKFAAGDDWWDFAVHLVLDELIFAVGVLGLALIAHAFFPRATGKFVAKAVQKTGAIAFTLVGLFFAAMAFVAITALVDGALRHFRVLG